MPCVNAGLGVESTIMSGTKAHCSVKERPRVRHGKLHIVTPMNRIEDQEQYNGIREYRNELRDEFDSPTIRLSWKEIVALHNRIKELDKLLYEADQRDPWFTTNYLVAPPNLGTY